LAQIYGAGHGELLGGVKCRLCNQMIRGNRPTDGAIMSAASKLGGYFRMKIPAMNSKNKIQQLIDNPVERLSVELKRWLDPRSEAGIEKIAKGCLALFNNDGGHMVIGIRDDGQPDRENVPSDVRAAFHIDVVQAIVSRFSHTQIEIAVDYPNRDGQEFPVITVPRGVKTPAVTKSQIGKIKPDEVYVRSLSSNNTASSSKPTRRDWDRLIRFCLENREADIGGFFRRHLGVSVDLDLLRSSFSLPASIEQQVMDLLESGRQRFDEINLQNSLPDVGFVEIGIAIDGKSEKSFEANQAFLHRIQQHRADYSGWPPFVYIHNPKAEEWNPYVFQDSWEANIIAGPMGMGGGTIDFWSMNPKGQFYTKRALQVDMGENGVAPLTVIDPILQLRRITEVIAIGLSCAESLEYDLENSQIAYAFRWTRLAGRVLSTWAHPGRMLRSAPKCVDDEVVETVFVPADTPTSSLTQYVEKVGAGLMRHFGGYDKIGREVVDEVVRETLGRRT